MSSLSGNALSRSVSTLARPVPVAFVNDDVLDNFDGLIFEYCGCTRLCRARRELAQDRNPEQRRRYGHQHAWLGKASPQLLNFFLKIQVRV